MSHRQQIQFCKKVRRLYPHFFKNKIVIDIGSQDINGSNKRFFSRCDYIGVDIMKGKNVDWIGNAHDELPVINRHFVEKYKEKYHHTIKHDNIAERPISTIISTEALEHDLHWQKTLKAMYDYLRPGGLLLITCAGEGRPEHGTENHSPQDSPATPHYYLNITNGMFGSVLKPSMFEVYHLAQDKNNYDLQFFGIKTPTFNKSALK